MKSFIDEIQIAIAIVAIMSLASIYPASNCPGADTYTVEVLYPQVGQVGTTVDVTVEGDFLKHPEQVLFYQPGIRCISMLPVDEIVDHRTSQQVKVEPGKTIRLTFEIAKDAAIGEYQLRLRTRDNLSEMITFWVTPFPVVHEEHTWIDRDGSRNDSPEHSQAIPLNCTVSGFLPGSAPQDHDWYRIDCELGQTVSIEAVATRLGTLHYGGLNDPAIRVYDSQGREVAHNDDNALHMQDPVVSFAAAESGTFYIDMHQQMDYEAGRLRHYLLHVGTFERPLVAFPLGGQAGTTSSIQLLGGLVSPKVEQLMLPTKPGNYEASYFPVQQSRKYCGTLRPTSESQESASTNAPPSPNRLHIASFPNVMEQATPSSKTNPQMILESLPVAINGHILNNGETDWYRFTAKKGERYRVRSYSSTLDSELDPFVWLLPADGTDSKLGIEEDDSQWEQHDLVGHHYRHQTKERLDPIFIFEADVDGDYLIGIGDTRRESGPRHVYRVEFEPHIDSAFVHFDAYPSYPRIVRDRIVLFPGHTYSRPVMVQPGFGSKYEGLLQLRCDNLPDGVTIKADPFLQTAGKIPVSFHADANAQIGGFLLDLVVEPVEEKDRPLFRGGFVQVNQATNRRGDFAMYFNRTRKMALAVVEGATFDIAVDQPATALVRNGQLEVNVRVNRHSGFDGAVYCEFDWLPEGINKQPPLIIEAGQTEAVYKLSASGNAKFGTFPISITGRENVGGNVRTGAGFHFVCSDPVTLSVGEPYLTVKLLRTAIERGKTGTIDCEITHHRSFKGSATLKLGRLPFGVEQLQPFPTITASDKAASFQVKVTGDCLVGQYKDIFCEATVIEADHPVRQQSGNGILRVDAEREAK